MLFRGIACSLRVAGVLGLLLVLGPLAARAYKIMDNPVALQRRQTPEHHQGLRQQQQAKGAWPCQHLLSSTQMFRGCSRSSSTQSQHGQQLTAEAATVQLIGGRALRQSGSKSNTYTPPKFFISKVKAAVVNNYTWTISRLASTTGISLIADGKQRQQLGYTLTYTKVLQTRVYQLEGSADITNPSSSDTMTLVGLQVYVGTKSVTPACRSLPAKRYTMMPGEVLSCPFILQMDSDPGEANVAGFVETTSSNRVSSPPVPFSFTDCSTGSGKACLIKNNGDCVLVTDGSIIKARYKDVDGAAAAGPAPQSQLFEVPVIGTSTQGPPRVEPVLPDKPTDDTAEEPTGGLDQPDSTWWGRRLLLNTGENNVYHTGVTDNLGHSNSRRRLRQFKSDPNSNQFKWPYPQITGNRPPVGELGQPKGAVPPKRICDTTPFQFAMTFGPLLPASCGIYEVVNNASAAFEDKSRAPIVHQSYFYLTVLCPAPAEGTNTTQAGSAGFRSVDAAAVTPTAAPAAPNAPAQLSFGNFQSSSARTNLPRNVVTGANGGHATAAATVAPATVPPARRNSSSSSSSSSSSNSTHSGDGTGTLVPVNFGSSSNAGASIHTSVAAAPAHAPTRVSKGAVSAQQTHQPIVVIKPFGLLGILQGLVGFD